MWLVTTAALAALSTLFALALRGRYRLGMLSLMFWGATLMIFIDHLISWWEEGGPFLEIGKGGLFLGMLMAVPVFTCWIALLLKDRRS